MEGRRNLQKKIFLFSLFNNSFTPPWYQKIWFNPWSLEVRRKLTKLLEQQKGKCCFCCQTKVLPFNGRLFRILNPLPTPKFYLLIMGLNPLSPMPKISHGEIFELIPLLSIAFIIIHPNCQRSYFYIIIYYLGFYYSYSFEFGPIITMKI